MDNNSKTFYRFKFILLGDISVGKTCISTKFVKDKFADKYECTIGVEFKLKTIQLSPNITVDLQIWDTCGQERFKSITKQYYHNANGIIFVFDLCNLRTLLDIKEWMDDITSITNKENLSFLLLGNKCDLITERNISYSEAMSFAQKYNIEYMEVSAKEGVNINESFEKLAWMAVHMEESKPKKKDEVSKRNIVIEEKEEVKKDSDCC